MWEVESGDKKQGTEERDEEGGEGVPRGGPKVGG